MKCNIRIIAGAVLLALAPLAHGQEGATNPGQSRVTTRLATSFTPLAGSEENARSLVTALRNGSEVTLLAPPEGGTGDPVATTFTPPTRPMGWGNVSHSLSLAQDSLARLGITNPTNAELQAALMGGDIVAADGSTVTLRGILQMRADGMGWGNIAKASGTTMGAVVSSTKAMQGKVSATVTTTTGAATTAKASAGITTAAGTNATSGGGKSAKGITTASGAARSSASGGLVTAEGSAASHGRSGGLTTAASGTGGGNGYGRGMVTASGASTSSNASVTSAAGPGNGAGRGNGNGKGKGG